MITRDMARTTWYKKPRKDRRSGRDVGKALNAIMA
jgi:hypothetical protein